MKTKLALTAFLCFAALAVFAKPKPVSLRYDIECAGTGSQGSYLVKVWVYGNKSISPDVIKQCAVHGVIFKGFAGRSGCTAQRPLAPNPGLEQEKADFFDAFFHIDKAYSKYVTEVDGSTERVKVGKQYKLGAVVSVSKDLLRKDLEAAGVIRGLSGGF